MIRIFLSYPSEVVNVVTRIYNILRESLAAREIDVNIFFAPECTDVGHEYTTKIKEACENCDIFVYFLTDESARPEHYCRTELSIVNKKWKTRSGRLFPFCVAGRWSGSNSAPDELAGLTIQRESIGNMEASVCKAVVDAAVALRNEKLVTSTEKSVDDSISHFLKGTTLKRPAHGPTSNPTRMTGRQGQLEEIYRYVSAAEGQLVPRVAIVGMPGVGKTAMASQIYRMAVKDQLRFPGGVYWAHVYNLSAGDILANMHLEFQFDPAPLRGIGQDEMAIDRAFALALTRFRPLLILDDVNQREVLTEVLHRTQFACPMIVTTRDRSVENLNLETVEIDVLPGKDAQRLLVRSSMGAVHADGLDDSAIDKDIEARPSAERTALVELCDDKYLAGLPLAIELAGRKVRAEAWSFYDYKEKFNRSRTANRSIFDEMLRSRDGEVGDRPLPVEGEKAARAKLNAVWNAFWFSFRDIGDEHPTANKAFVYAGHATANVFTAEEIGELIEATSKEVQGAMDRLRTLSLIKFRNDRDGYGNRLYGMHPLLREFAAEMQRRDYGGEDIGEASLAYTYRRVRASPTLLKSPFMRIKAREVFKTYSTSISHLDESIDLAIPLAKSFDDARQHDSAIMILEKAVELAAMRHRMDTLLDAWGQLARQYNIIGEIEKQQAVLEAAYALIESLPGPNLGGDCNFIRFLYTSMLLTVGGIKEVAPLTHAFLRNTLAVRPRTEGHLLAVTSVAQLMRCLGNPVFAQDCFRVAEIVADNFGNKWNSMVSVGNMMLVALDMGDAPEAMRCLHRLRETGREVGTLAAEVYARSSECLKQANEAIIEGQPELLAKAETTLERFWTDFVSWANPEIQSQFAPDTAQKQETSQANSRGVLKAQILLALARGRYEEAVAIEAQSMKNTGNEHRRLEEQWLAVACRMLAHPNDQNTHKRLDEALSQAIRLGNNVIRLRLESVRCLTYAPHVGVDEAAKKLVATSTALAALGYVNPLVRVFEQRLVGIHGSDIWTKASAAAHANSRLLANAGALAAPFDDIVFDPYAKLPEEIRHPRDGRVMKLVRGGAVLEPGSNGSFVLLPFYIDCCPVTHAEYKRFLDDMQLPPPPHWPGGEMLPKFAELPMVGVTLDEACGYLEWSNRRLPVAEEWEMAAGLFRGHVYPGMENAVEAKALIEQMLNARGQALAELMHFEGKVVSGCVLGEVPHIWPVSDFVFSKGIHVDRMKFKRLLEGSLSLSPSEKVRVLKAVPTLSQFQVDALIETFTEEANKFMELAKTHPDDIKKLIQKRAFEGAGGALYSKNFFEQYPKRLSEVASFPAGSEGIDFALGKIRQWTMSIKFGAISKGASWRAMRPEEFEINTDIALDPKERFDDTGIIGVIPVFDPFSFSIESLAVSMSNQQRAQWHIRRTNPSTLPSKTKDIGMTRLVLRHLTRALELEKNEPVAIERLIDLVAEELGDPWWPVQWLEKVQTHVDLGGKAKELRTKLERFEKQSVNNFIGAKDAADDAARCIFELLQETDTKASVQIVLDHDSVSCAEVRERWMVGRPMYAKYRNMLDTVAFVELRILMTHYCRCLDRLVTCRQGRRVQIVP